MKGTAFESPLFYKWQPTYRFTFQESLGLSNLIIHTHRYVYDQFLVQDFERFTNYRGIAVLEGRDARGQTHMTARCRCRYGCDTGRVRSSFTEHLIDQLAKFLKRTIKRCDKPTRHLV